MSFGAYLKNKSLAGGGVSNDPALQGLPGADGKSIRSGTVAPANGVGNDGDFYINTTTSSLHGPKASGAWPVGVSLRGQQGEGPSFAATADEAFTVGQLGYIKANGNAALASALAEGKEAIGFATNAAGIGQQVTFKVSGSLITGLSGLTPNAPYFMGTTPGAIVAAASAPVAQNNVLLRVGTALSSTVLLFDPEAPITL